MHADKLALAGARMQAVPPTMEIEAEERRCITILAQKMYLKIWGHHIEGTDPESEHLYYGQDNYEMDTLEDLLRDDRGTAAIALCWAQRGGLAAGEHGAGRALCGRKMRAGVVPEAPRWACGPRQRPTAGAWTRWAPSLSVSSPSQGTSVPLMEKVLPA